MPYNVVFVNAINFIKLFRVISLTKKLTIRYYTKVYKKFVEEYLDPKSVGLVSTKFKHNYNGGVVWWAIFSIEIV